jgi:amino-acid N-acetyltransferase
MSDVRIRAASADDLPAVKNLLQAAALPLDGVTDFFPSNYAVGEAGNEVIGAIGVERYGDNGLLRSAVVADAQRGTGLGSRLANERIEWCGRQNMRNVYLLTTTAAPFFEKLGFERVERADVPAEVQQAPEFVSICPSSAVVMRRACP